MATRRQEMPPPGGFKPMNYSRVPARTILGAKTLILGHFAFTAGSYYLYSLTVNKVNREEVERRSSILALLPMIQAERDREYLKQLRKNRDEEENLMKNVEGWEVGTYFGEPIYKTLPPDTLVKPSSTEYYAHSSKENNDKRINVTKWD